MFLCNKALLLRRLIKEVFKLKENSTAGEQKAKAKTKEKTMAKILSEALPEKYREGKISFVIYSEWEENCALLSDEQRGKLFSAIMAYGGRGEDISKELDGVTAMCFSFMKNQLKRDAEKYMSIVKRNSENGKKGGRPRRTKEDRQNDTGYSAREEASKSEKTEGFSEKAKKADNDNDDDNEDVNVNVDDNDTENKNENENDAAAAEERLRRLRQEYEAVKERRRAQQRCVRTEQMFDEFWKEYPKKENMVRAKRAFMGLSPDEETFKKLMEAVKRSKSTEKWKTENGRFVPLAANYILDRRFEDRFILPDGTKERSYDVESIKKALLNGQV